MKIQSPNFFSFSDPENLKRPNFFLSDKHDFSGFIFRCCNVSVRDELGPRTRYERVFSEWAAREVLVRRARDPPQNIDKGANWKEWMTSFNEKTCVWLKEKM